MCRQNSYEEMHRPGKQRHCHAVFGTKGLHLQTESSKALNISRLATKDLHSWHCLLRGVAAV